MKVAELIKILETKPQDAYIYLIDIVLGEVGDYHEPTNSINLYPESDSFEGKYDNKRTYKDTRIISG